jgi:tRNA-specific 2-thiouridylase
VGGAPPAAGARLTAKTRYRQADAPCEVTSIEGGQFILRFEAPQWAATPGQSAVLYDGEVCLGGGVIDRVDAAPAGATVPAGSGESASAAG